MTPAGAASTMGRRCKGSPRADGTGSGLAGGTVPATRCPQRVKGRLDEVAVLERGMSGPAVRDLAGQALASGGHHGRGIVLLVILVIIVVIVAIAITYLVRSRRNGPGAGRADGDQ